MEVEKNPGKKRQVLDIGEGCDIRPTRGITPKGENLSPLSLR